MKIFHILLIVLLPFFATNIFGQSSDSLVEHPIPSSQVIEPEQQTKTEIPTFERGILTPEPVLFFDDTLFYVYESVGVFSAKDRAKRLQTELESIAENDNYIEDSLYYVEKNGALILFYGKRPLSTLTGVDTLGQNQTHQELANDYLVRINGAITSHSERTGLFNTLFRIGLLVAILIGFLLIIKYLNKLFTYLNRKAVAISSKYLKGIYLKKYEFLSVEQEIQIVATFLKLIKWLLIIIVIYTLLPVLFGVFPATRGIASTLIGYVLDPLKGMIFGFINFIPELIIIIVIITVTHYIIRFLRFLTEEVKKGKLRLPGFYPDWAYPTYNLLKIVIYAFSFIMIFPYLPGSDSPIFQGVSVFLGILVSLGSSSAIGNIIAGLVITYMRAFKMGDRVKIGATVGDVLEKTMLVTRLKTSKNEIVTIPNSAILNGTTINFSANARKIGLILHTTITIGYDVPWRKTHELLLAAAKKTNDIQQKPEPFVLQTSLDDFYVSYQINGYTKKAERAPAIYSELYSHIQDEFNTAGIEILSPHYRAPRDGSPSTIPEEYLPKGYETEDTGI